METTTDNIFFLGLSGMGMAPLALYLNEAGCQVRGCDDHWREPVRTLLESRGIPAASCTQLPADTRRVVYSSAIAPGHPLLRLARERGLGTLRRGELLAEAVRGRRLIAVVGSHGKTTTTALLIHALRSSGHEVGYLLGALFADSATPPAHHAAAPWVAAEIDESDGTIDHFAPEITVAVNFDWDHADRYRTEAELEATFINLFRRTRQLVLLPQWDARLRRLAETAGTPFRTFGPEGDFSARASGDDGARQRLALNGTFPKQIIELPLGGEFNAANAAAALAATHAAFGGISAEPFRNYPGVSRRQDVLLRRAALEVYADYAHHPTEIAALLRSLRARSPGRLLVVFQPHRYTRTKQFAAAFAEALGAADRVFLLPVYAASEPPLPEGTAAAILAAAPDPGKFSLHESFDDLAATLQATLAESSAAAATLAFVGAGDIDQFAEAFVRRLTDESTTPTAPVINTAHPLDWFDVVRPRLHPETLVHRNEPLADKTTLGVGGPARYYAEPADVEDLALLLHTAKAEGTPVFCLGRGSNLIVADTGFPGLVLRLTHPNWKKLELEAGGRIYAGAGARLKELCGFAARHALAGLEFLEGIPGSVGGSLRMNAGAMGGWIFDVIEQVEYVTAEGETRRAPRAEFHPSYRECPELLNAVAIGAIFHAPTGAPPEEIRQRMEMFSTKRKATQPRERSAGCLFKNPAGSHAGKLIDGLGLKGRRVGALEISSIHANFIINHGGGTAADALTLARQVRDEVLARAGIELEPEVFLLGAKWEEVLK
ncbi:MAG TPA: UDP-N-acetylmuramate dehydrogenase [Opitutales bacterium]|nr:UDP-N-acetylmuramate dehydrogenase [Opitutales bacterium]